MCKPGIVCRSETKAPIASRQDAEIQRLRKSGSLDEKLQRAKQLKEEGNKLLKSSTTNRTVWLVIGLWIPLRAGSAGHQMTKPGRKGKRSKSWTPGFN